MKSKAWWDVGERILCLCYKFKSDNSHVILKYQARARLALSLNVTFLDPPYFFTSTPACPPPSPPRPGTQHLTGPWAKAREASQPSPQFSPNFAASPGPHPSGLTSWSPTDTGTSKEGNRNLPFLLIQVTCCPATPRPHMKPFPPDRSRFSDFLVNGGTSEETRIH